MKCRKVSRIAVALLLTGTGVVTGQTSTEESKGPPPKTDPASVERGKGTFVAACGFCHGSNATGGEKGPDLLRSVLVLDDENGKTIGPVILRGRPDKGMPRFPFTPQQIADIAAFLHNSIKNAIDRDSYKILNIVTGDPKAGAAYFNGAGHCSSCHSVTGDLKGIGAKYEPVTLQGKMLQPNYSWTEGNPPHTVIAISVTVTLAVGRSGSRARSSTTTTSMSLFGTPTAPIIPLSERRRSARRNPQPAPGAPGYVEPLHGCRYPQSDGLSGDSQVKIKSFVQCLSCLGYGAGVCADARSGAAHEARHRCVAHLSRRLFRAPFQHADTDQSVERQASDPGLDLSRSKWESLRTRLWAAKDPSPKVPRPTPAFPPSKPRR